MHKQESTLETETHEILRDFEIKIIHLILARRQDLVIVNKKKKSERTWWIIDFAVPREHKVKLKERKKKKEIKT